MHEESVPKITQKRFASKQYETKVLSDTKLAYIPFKLFIFPAKTLVSFMLFKDIIYSNIQDGCHCNMHMKTCINIERLGCLCLFTYKMYNSQGCTLGGVWGGVTPPIFGRKLQKIGPKFIQNCGKSRSHKPVSRCVMSSILHSL